MRGCHTQQNRISRALLVGNTLSVSTDVRVGRVCKIIHYVPHSTAQPLAGIHPWPTTHTFVLEKIVVDLIIPCLNNGCWLRLTLMILIKMAEGDSDRVIVDWNQVSLHLYVTWGSVCQVKLPLRDNQHKRNRLNESVGPEDEIGRYSESLIYQS